MNETFLLHNPMFAVLRKWMEYSKYRSSFEEILRLDILYANDDISYQVRKDRITLAISTVYSLPEQLIEGRHSCFLIFPINFLTRFIQ